MSSHHANYYAGISVLDIHPNGTHIALGIWTDNSALAHDVVINEVKVKSPEKIDLILKYNIEISDFTPGSVMHTENVKYHPNGKHLLIRDTNGNLYVWNVDAKAIKYNLQLNVEYMGWYTDSYDATVTISPDGEYFAAVNPQVSLYDFESGELLHTFK